MNPVGVLALSHLLAFCVGVGLTWWAAMRAFRQECGGFVLNGLCTRPYKHRGDCRA